VNVGDVLEDGGVIEAVTHMESIEWAIVRRGEKRYVEPVEEPRG